VGELNLAVREQDPLYKGLTRPAMIKGMPFTFIIYTVMASALLLIWTRNIILAGFIFMIVFAVGMDLFYRHGHQVGRLLYIKWRYCYAIRNRRFWKMDSYEPR